MVSGFEEGVIGMKAGEDRTIKVTFPEDYFAKEVAGKEAAFDIKVISVSEPNEVEFTAELVKKLGVKSGNREDLTEEIRKNLERELARVVKLKLKSNIFDILLEQNPMEVPKALIEQEAKRIHDQVHPHHSEDHHHSDDEMASFNQAAKRNVALGLLVAELVKKNQLSVNQDLVQAHIAGMSSVYENPAEVIRWYENNKRAYTDIEMQVLEDQVIELLLKNVSITEKVIGYHELINA